MDYDLIRYNTIRNSYRVSIRNSLDTFKPGCKTIMLLPGGMGSKLDRSKQVFDEIPPGAADFEPIWMDIGILFHSDVLKLEMDREGRDIGGYVVVPDGPLRYLIKAYDGSEMFFTDRENGDYNYLIFGYDWRRPLAESAAFLEEFLNLFRQAVFSRHHIDPLPKTTLLCHSQGGLVARVFIERRPDPGSWFESIITAGTPFYGTSSHQRRYYIGQFPLSQLYGAKKVAQITGTLPGPYSLMCIDKETFDTYHAQLGLSADAYPMVDYKTDEPKDPYSQANLDHYPGDWVNPRYLENARQIRQLIARPIPDAIGRRFFNIRSARDKKTPTRQAWKELPAGFDPDKNRAPFKTLSTEGGGDGTIPCWSAWHASTPQANTIDLQEAKDHTTIAEHEEVLQIVKQIVDTGRPDGARKGKNRVYGEKIKPAKPKVVKDFLKEVQAGEIKQDDQRVYDETIWRRIYQEVKR
jgi:pimeloyl-ACP methyl ester carboxylesterase